MIMKVPSSDWSDQFDHYVIEEESDTDVNEDQPDFSEYLWMENEEEFDKIELQRLEEEDIMNECLDAMLEDELEAQINEWEKAKNEELSAALSSLAVSDRNVGDSMLNPLADEFIPRAHFELDLASAS